MSDDENNVSEDYYDDEEESDNENDCPSFPLYFKQSRFYFYEPTNTYIGLAMAFVYIVLAALQCLFDMSYPWLLLVPAFLTNVPHVFRHRFDYLPNLFSQVFCCWACLLYNLTMVCFNDSKPLKTVNPITNNYSICFFFSLFMIYSVLFFHTRRLFKVIYLRHYLGPLRMSTYWLLVVLAVLNIFCFLFNMWSNLHLHKFPIDPSKNVVFVWIGLRVLHSVAAITSVMTGALCLKQICFSLHQTYYHLRSKDELSQSFNEVSFFYVKDPAHPY